MMDRRNFLGGIAAVSVFNPVSAMAQDSDPLGRLADIRTKQRYVTNPQKFDFVIFMTAQEQERDCGGAFTGTQGLMDLSSVSDQIQPVLVMPRLSLQPDPDAKENLVRATRTYANLNFKILTGDIDDMRAVSSAYGNIFEFQGQKITGHTLDAILMKKGRSDELVRHAASDYLTYSHLVQKIAENCTAPENAKLCIG
jgi:hypothetical protein